MSAAKCEPCTFPTDPYEGLHYLSRVSSPFDLPLRNSKLSIKLGNGLTTPVAGVGQRLRPMLILLFGLFFLSGFSALAYQTAWQRMLGAFAGSDSVAVTIIVGAFLFGLGV